MKSLFTLFILIILDYSVGHAQDQVLPVFYSNSAFVTNDKISSIKNKPNPAKLLVKVIPLQSGKQSVALAFQYKINKYFSVEAGGGAFFSQLIYLPLNVWLNNDGFSIEGPGISDEIVDYSFIKNFKFAPIISTNFNYHFAKNGLRGPYVGVGLDWSKINDTYNRGLSSVDENQSLRNISPNLTLGFQKIGSSVSFSGFIGAGYNILKAKIFPDEKDFLVTAKKNVFSFEFGIKIGLIAVEDK